MARTFVQCRMDETIIRTFGAFEFDLSTGQLRRGGLNIPLQPQPARVLAAIVLRAGDLVPREDVSEW